MSTSPRTGLPARVVDDSGLAGIHRKGEMTLVRASRILPEFRRTCQDVNLSRARASTLTRVDVAAETSRGWKAVLVLLASTFAFIRCPWWEPTAKRAKRQAYRWAVHLVQRTPGHSSVASARRYLQASPTDTRFPTAQLLHFLSIFIETSADAECSSAFSVRAGRTPPLRLRR